MKNVITAIGNKTLNEKLKQTQKYEVLSRDIQYKEGVLEFLNINKNVDILIISEILEGEIDFKELINLILQKKEDIEIIVLLEEENAELRTFLYSKRIYKIYINNEIDIDTFIISLEENDELKTSELTKEIEKLKQIIKENSNKITVRIGRITAITGAYGSREKYTCVYFM